MDKYVELTTDLCKHASPDPFHSELLGDCPVPLICIPRERLVHFNAQYKRLLLFSASVTGIDYHELSAIDMLLWLRNPTNRGRLGCHWKEKEVKDSKGESVWHTSCGKVWSFCDGDNPAEARFVFCCFCGGQILATGKEE